MNCLGTRLIELREGFTAYEVAKEIGIAQSMLSRYESGKQLPTKDTLKKLSNYYSVDYAELRILYYEDFFADDVEEQIIITQWAKRKEQIL